MNKVLSVFKKYQILCVVIVTLIALMVLKDNAYYLHLVLMCEVWAILASSLNIAVGLTGLSNLAHATFFGFGAYATAILNSRYDWPFYLTMIMGGLIAMAFGVVLGLPTLRLKGVFLALVTTGFGQIMRVIEINWVSLTNGPMGISGIGRATLSGYKFTRLNYAYVILAILVLSMYVTKRITKSKIGRALYSVKYDETAAKSLGVNITYYKVLAYVIASGIAGIAGAIYANYIGFISPDTFTAADSTTILCMVILGGASVLIGPVIGAVILTVVPEVLRFTDLFRIIFVGIVMVVGVIASYYNFGGRLHNWAKRIFGEKSVAADPQNVGGA